ncbi:MAG: serine protein kinase PrkA [Deltaproteobacteria bacterium]|nr:serine protein kinase PrkA [Deltaproteobacteria bacterium]
MSEREASPAPGAAAPETVAHETLGRIGEALRARFVAERRVLSFAEFLEVATAAPYQHTRDASRYLRDCFDHFGTTIVKRPGGRDVLRYRLFDLPFVEEGRARDALVGQEEIQGAFYRANSNFVREGRINRLVLLHGPNGSAKSTFVNCMMRALEHYSCTDQGALYYFSWIFPRGKDGRALGFGSTDDTTYKAVDSYAHLPDAAIDLRLDSEVRESPLSLLPTDDRRAFLEAAYVSTKETRERPPRLILDGELGAKNRKIFDALMTAYRGDLARVLAHVRVERLSISQRYRRGAVTIGPQMAVDATERQITMDRSLAALPASLASVALYETHGELVEATNGILEFSDLLKRPLDAWRYLLLAVEEGEVALNASVLPLNTIFVATSNDVHLKAFREHHEYRSFRGRLSLIRVPYLVDYRAEQAIYDAQIAPQVRGHKTPHATYIAALWAVLTRLRRPRADSYALPSHGKKLAPIVASLTPLEKAELYADGTVPDRLSNEEAAELRAHIDDVRHETDAWPSCEGSSGASPREVRTLMLDAAQDPVHEGLSPIGVLSRIKDLCETEDYDFLRDAVDGGYHDHRGFIEVVRQRWLDRVDDELRQATGLVEESQYLDLFDRYVTSVSYWLKKEKVPNPHTGKDEEPDTRFMESVEQMLGVVRNHDGFRKDLISVVAAYAIDHPGERPVYSRVFPRYIQQLREASWASRKKQLAEIVEDVLRLTASQPVNDAERQRRARTTIDTMTNRFGYPTRGLRDVLAELLQRRYAA